MAHASFRTCVTRPLRDSGTFRPCHCVIIIKEVLFLGAFNRYPFFNAYRGRTGDRDREGEASRRSNAQNSGRGEERDVHQLVSTQLRNIENEPK